MNIVWCVIDCLRHDALSVNNYPRPTSVALDNRLSEDFVSFEDACTQSAFTFSVLSSMITGAYPSTHGALRFSDKLTDEIPTLRDMWVECNYESHAIPGMNFVGSEWGTKRAFDLVHNLSQAKSQRESSQARADEVRKKTEDVLSTSEDSVFLSWFFDLHTPRLSGRDFNGSNVARDHYDTELKFVTEEIEQLCQTLESRGDYDDTIIIITGDHGDLFREVNQFDGSHIPRTLGTVLESSNFFGTDYHGHLEKPLYDELLHVPLYMKLPDCNRGGQRFQGQVELIDILPTILEMTDGTPAESIEGTSLLSTLDTEEGKDYVFAEVEPTASSGRFQIARSQQYKILRHTPPDKTAIKNPTLYTLRRWFTKREQFVARIDEQHELDRDCKQAAEHRQKLRNWFEREQLNVENKSNKPQKLSSEQREELEALGYL